MRKNESESERVIKTAVKESDNERKGWRHAGCEKEV